MNAILQHAQAIEACSDVIHDVLAIWLKQTKLRPNRNQDESKVRERQANLTIFSTIYENTGSQQWSLFLSGKSVFVAPDCVE